MRNKGILLDKATMDLVISPKLDAEGLIVEGLIVGDVTTQNQAILLSTQPGELKEDITAGVGVASMVDDEDIPKWRRRIKMQLEADGQKVEGVAVEQQNVKIYAKY